MMMAMMMVTMMMLMVMMTGVIYHKQVDKKSFSCCFVQCFRTFTKGGRKYKKRFLRQRKPKITSPIVIKKIMKW